MSEDGHGDTGRLERRARWLLRAWPGRHSCLRTPRVSPYTTGLSLVTVLVAVCALAWLLRQRVHAAKQ
jgi:hypothetical protein